MDSVVALAVINANLQTARIRSVNANAADNIPANVMSGGFLAVQTDVKLTEDETGNSVISSITLKVEGFPKGIKRENSQIGDRVFCVEVTAQGFYSWKTPPHRHAIHHPDLAHALGRPMYALAASEIREIALKMGFNGVHIESDIPRAQEEGIQTTPSENLKPQHLISRDLTKKAAIKTSAPKKSKSVNQ